MLPVTVSSAIQPAPVTTIAPAGSAVPEANIGRLPTTTVAASIAAQESYNQKQGGGTARFAAGQEISSPSLGLGSGFGITPSITSAPARFGFSSPFLAQLLGQSLPGESNALTAFYSDNASLPLDPDTWEHYALARYKPSDAALPPSPSPRERVLLIRAAIEAAQQQQIKAYTQPALTQSTAANITVSAGHLQASLPAARLAQEPVATPSVVRRSLVSGRGTDAYLNTSARNNGTGIEPEPQVALSL